MVDGVTNLFTVAASSSVTIDLDLTDVYGSLSGMFVVTYPQTTSPTGLTCVLYQGYGPGLAVNMYQPLPCLLHLTAPSNPRSTGQVYSTIGLETAGDGDPITMAAPTINNSSAATKYSPFSLDRKFMSKFVSFKLTNTDTANSCTVQLRLNV